MHSIQQKLLEIVDAYNLGSLPLRDIAKIINEVHPQIVKYHLEALEKKCLVEWDRDKKIIRKCSKSADIISAFAIVPVVGAANCGQANMYADENVVGHIKVSYSLLKNCSNVFAIKAIGHSMNCASVNGKCIEDGDFVIIDPTDKNIDTNDYVLSIIDDVANIKRIVIDRENEQITLVSESTLHYPNIYIGADEVGKFIVNGKVLQVIKTI